MASASASGDAPAAPPSPFSYQTGQRLLCDWPRGAEGDEPSESSSPREPRECEVIERKQLLNHECLYYVHYVAYNRRLDEWVGPERLQPLPSAKPNGSAERKRKLGLCEGGVAEDLAGDTAGELDAATQREHEEATRVKNIHKVILGKWEMETWYYSPFPADYAQCETLYFCEFDLHFVKKKAALQRYLRRCEQAHPPGDEIYRSDRLSVFEIDGAVCRTYCQNLCLLAKLFLDHKTLYYDVKPFIFYVLCECDEQGCHPVAYFSKEKASVEGYNLACILTLPPYQRKGYGRFLIMLSYALSRAEGKLGTPERPLSDLGMLSYRSYWAYALLRVLQHQQGSISMSRLSEMTAIKTEDVMSTLNALGLLKWKGKQHVLCISPKVLREHLASQEARAKSSGIPDVEPAQLNWVPHHLRKR